ncbi:MAG: class I SAM-dependent methyltransferase [SAR324 cluster bacterium]|nr:class I SAM-dependent methyltransferase [SAR324 cluster bacterium]
MKTSLSDKSTLEEIRNRFDEDVERFSNLETGQQTAIDAPLAAELITQNAVAITPKAKTILDIGCGAGNNTLRLLQLLNPLDCDLVDISKPMLDRAVKRISEVNSGKIRTFQNDIRRAELQKNHYDIIIAAAVLHHLRDEADWEFAFSKIFQLTAPGGSFWITDLVSHENSFVQETMWNRYGQYIESLGGVEYREKVFAYIDKEDSPRPVTFQAELLRRVGFIEVDILHKNSCFAALGARKAP